MSNLLKLIRLHLTGNTKDQSTTADLEQALVALVERESANIAINSALSFRKQGRIDKSIGLMTKVNRAHLDAIISIQVTVDKLLSRQHRGVVFAKFRQFYPFEMGVEEGDDAVRLVANFHASLEDSGDTLCKRLRTLETDTVTETERLEFFRRRFEDGSEDATINDAQVVVKELAGNIDSVKLEIVRLVSATVDEYLEFIGVTGVSSKAKYDLFKGLYTLVTSATKTAHARDVQVQE